jgi:hypothetical protein
VQLFNLHDVASGCHHIGQVECGCHNLNEQLRFCHQVAGGCTQLHHVKLVDQDLDLLENILHNIFFL